MTELRKSGIDVLGEIPWGSHFCNFYETKQDLLDTLLPYFKAGLESNEFCLWVVPNPELITVEEAKEALQQVVPDLDRHLSDGNIEILNGLDWYLEENVFKLERVTREWDAKLKRALALGYNGIRVSGDTFWLEEKGWKDFYTYEKQLNDFITDLPMTVLCTYPLAKSAAFDIFDVLHTHQFAIARRQGVWVVLETSGLIQARAEIKRLNKELEQRVGERTRQLAKANNELRKEIAERRKSEKTLVESENYLHTIIQTELHSVKLLGINGELENINPAGLEMIEADSLQQVIGKSVLDLINKPYRNSFKNLTKNVFKGNSGTLEFEITGLKGTHRWLEIHAVPLKNTEGKILSLMGITVDITERKKAEEELHQLNEELRSLSSHLQNVREEERIQIARDIHDDLGQQLTGLKMDLNWLNKKLETEDEVIKQKMNNIIELIDETLKSVRRISSHLRPSLLDDFGLIAALEWHSEEVAKRSEIKVNFSADMPEPNIPVAMATGIFRIYQELLTNTVRHADAHIIKSSLRLKDKYLILKINDDGQGMDPESTRTKKTLGLIGIKERTFALGGKYDLKSEPGKGTEVQISIPL